MRPKQTPQIQEKQKKGKPEEAFSACRAPKQAQTFGGAFLKDEEDGEEVGRVKKSKKWPCNGFFKRLQGLRQGQKPNLAW
jgi:hypothetical protein